MDAHWFAMFDSFVLDSLIVFPPTRFSNPSVHTEVQESTPSSFHNNSNPERYLEFRHGQNTVLEILSRTRHQDLDLKSHPYNSAGSLGPPSSSASSTCPRVSTGLASNSAASCSSGFGLLLLLEVDGFPSMIGNNSNLKNDEWVLI